MRNVSNSFILNNSVSIYLCMFVHNIYSCG